MKGGDKPTTRGGNEPFPVTHWTEILAARSDSEPRRQAALEELLTAYWKPVYCYLRSKGHEKEASKDLTQGFFHEVVLGRDLIQRADRAKGRFRTFLLKALGEYAASVRRADKAKKRLPEGGFLPLEGIDTLGIPELTYCRTPQEVFDYAWASALLDEVLTEVEGECRETGMATHWEVFRARILGRILENAASPSLTELCAKHHISSEMKASNMATTVKRRFYSILRRRVRQLVGSDSEIDQEIRDIIEIFSKGGAGSGSNLRI